MENAVRMLTSMLGAGALVLNAAAWAAPTFMSAEWARDACAAWNADAALGKNLHESGWAGNHKNRGYKLLRVARGDCPATGPRAELRIVPRDGRAQCSQGGIAGPAPLDTDVDYLMTADTKRWLEMGRGEYGPMRAMMFGRLAFEGPMGEAMGNMGPFEGFLQLVGKVPGDTASCPK
jgi:putative sterol carrier protein